MLYLVVIGIVCAVTALGEGLVTIGEKKYKTIAPLCSLKEREKVYLFSSRGPCDVDTSPAFGKSDRKTFDPLIGVFGREDSDIACVGGRLEPVKSLIKRNLLWSRDKFKNINSSDKGTESSVKVPVDPSEKSMVKKRQACENLACCGNVFCPLPPYPRPCCEKPCCPKPCCQKPCCPKPCCPKPCCPKPCCPKPCCQKPYCPPPCYRRPCCGRPCCRRPCCRRPNCRFLYCKKTSCSRPWCKKPCCRKPCCRKPCCPTVCCPKPWCPRPCPCPCPCPYPCPLPCPCPCPKVCYPRPCCPRPCCTKPCFPQSCSSKPCFPKPCYSKPCFPKPCYSKPCFPKPCYSKPCFPKPCYSKPCFPKPCCPGPCYPLCCPKPCCKKQPPPKGCSCLTLKEKKKLMELINCKNSKNRKRRLDDIKLDQHLDIGKRIERLTKRLALGPDASNPTTPTTKATGVSWVPTADDDGPNARGGARVRRQTQTFRSYQNYYRNPLPFQDPGFAQLPLNWLLTNIYLQNDPSWRIYRNIVFRSNSLLSRLAPRHLGYSTLNPFGKYFRQFNRFAYFNRQCPGSLPSLDKRKRKKRFFRSKKNSSRIRDTSQNIFDLTDPNPTTNIKEDTQARETASQPPQFPPTEKPPSGDQHLSTAIERPFISEDGFYYRNLDSTPPLDFPPSSRHPVYDPYLNFAYFPFRYLNIRHALRTYLKERGVFPRSKPSFLGPYRKKRCGSCCGGCSSCSMPRKCWRSAPLLCIPYIRKGQDELLKYLIKSMQKLLGKPFPQKVDIFEKTKYKPCCKPKSYECDCDDIIPGCECPPQPPCQPPCGNPPQPRPCPGSPCPQVPSCPMGYLRALPPQCLFSAENQPNEFSGPFDQVPLAPLMDKFHSPLPAEVKPPERTPPPPCPNCMPFTTSAYYQTTEYPGNQPASSSATVDHTEPPTTSYPLVPSTVPQPVVFHPTPVAAWTHPETPIRNKCIPFGAYPLNAPLEVLGRDFMPSDGFPRYRSTLGINFRYPNRPQPQQNDINDLDMLGIDDIPPRISLVPSEPIVRPVKGSLKYNSPLSYYSPHYNGRYFSRNSGQLYSSLYGKMSNGYLDHLRRIAPSILENDYYNYPKHLRKYKNRSKYDLLGTLDYLPAFDYESDDKFPYGRTRIRQNFPVPWAYNNKFKKTLANEHPGRHKRSLDYSWPLPPDNYQYDYPDYPDPTYEDFYLAKPSIPDLVSGPPADGEGWRLPRKTHNRIPTPPTFQLFSDLAMAVGNMTGSFTTPVPERTTDSDPVIDDLTSTSSDRQKQLFSTEGPEYPNTNWPSDHTPKLIIGRYTKNGYEAQTTPATNKQTERSPPPTTASNAATNDKMDDSCNCSEMETESQLPTTLKAAVIAKGPKKQLTRPAPKVYAKVYPDVIWSDTGGGECLNEQASATTTTTTTAKPPTEKTTIQTSTASPDVRLQLLAICEGYLEVLKLVKGQNREEIDPDLSRYCESIISQSFNLPEQPLKPKFATPRPSLSTLSTERVQQDEKLDLLREETPESFQAFAGNQKYCAEDMLNDDRKPESSILKHSKTSAISLRHFKRKKTNSKTGSKSVRRLSSEGKGKERVPRNRRPNWRAWIVDSDENKLNTPQQLKDGQGSGKSTPTAAATETSATFTAEPISKSSSFSPSTAFSGTIAPKIAEKTTTETTTKEALPANASAFPVYAKNYGYDSGGELRQIEVLCRNINDSNHEKYPFRKGTVLALLLTSTKAPFVAKREDVTVVTFPVRYDTDETTETQPDDDDDDDNSNNDYDHEDATSSYPTTVTYRPFVPEVKPVPVELPKTNLTDSTTIFPVTVNVSTSVTVVTLMPLTGHMDNNGVSPRCLNSTSKLAPKTNKITAAKDKLQEYSIEFLNYAVYILPIMFTVLFFFCCTCCFYVLCKSSGHRKRCKRKRKRVDCSDVSSDESENNSKRKRQKQRNGKHICASRSTEGHAPKTRSFLKFLKTRRDSDKTDDPNLLPSGDVKGNHSDDACQQRKRPRADDRSETNDRREIIALLEDLKKIEIEHMEDKKSQKPVCVQYVTHNPDEVNLAPGKPLPPNRNKPYKIPPSYYPVCDNNLPYPEPEPGFPKGQRFPELDRLLPCDCSRFYGKPNFVDATGKPARLFKIFRDSSQNTAYLEREMDLFRSGNQNYIFSKYRTVSTDTSDEVAAGTRKKKQPIASGSPSRLHAVDPTAAPQHQSNYSFPCEHARRKRVCLKDDGVLCRL